MYLSIFVIMALAASTNAKKGSFETVKSLSRPCASSDALIVTYTRTGLMRSLSMYIQRIAEASRWAVTDVTSMAPTVSFSVSSSDGLVNVESMPRNARRSLRDNACAYEYACKDMCYASQ